MVSQLNNISFQGKFTTKMQGRNNILKDIPAVFARKTNGFDGSLELLRVKDNIMINYNNKQKTFVFDNYGDLTGEFTSQKTPETVEQIAESFAKFFKVLKAQDSYNKIIKKLNRTKVKTECALNANQKTYQQAIINGDKRAESLCLGIIEKNNKKLEEINLNFEQAKIRYHNFINKLAENNTRAQQYVKFITTI